MKGLSQSIASVLLADSATLCLGAGETSGPLLVDTNDFENGAGAAWSLTNHDVTPVGGRRFLGQFGNVTATLSLSNLPTNVAVESGDGFEPSPPGPALDVPVNPTGPASSAPNPGRETMRNRISSLLEGQLQISGPGPARGDWGDLRGFLFMEGPSSLDCCSRRRLTHQH